MNDFLKKMFIDEAKPALNRHSGSGGSNGYDVYFTLEYKIQTNDNINIDLSNATFNNPDNIPIFVAYEDVETGELSQFSPLNKNTNDLMLTTYGDDRGAVSNDYISLYDPEYDTYQSYCVKLSDIVGKQIPTINNVVLSRKSNDSNADGIRCSESVIELDGNYYLGHTGISLSDNYSTETVDVSLILVPFKIV